MGDNQKIPRLYENGKLKKIIQKVAMANSFCIMLSKLHEYVHVKSPGTEHHLKVTLFYSYYDQLGIKQFSSIME